MCQNKAGTWRARQAGLTLSADLGALVDTGNVTSPTSGWGWSEEKMGKVTGFRGVDIGQGQKWSLEILTFPVNIAYIKNL